MPTPNIILSKPYILVTLAESSIGITSQKAGFVIGYVQMVNSLCDSVIIGERVMFDITTAKAFYYGSTQYYLVDEALKFFKEPLAP